MATHYSVLAWRIPATGEAGGLPSMGLHRVKHDGSDLAAVAAAWVTLVSILIVYCTDQRAKRFGDCWAHKWDLLYN